jgi:hypothetical protein
MIGDEIFERRGRLVTVCLRWLGSDLVGHVTAGRRRA